MLPLFYLLTLSQLYLSHAFHRNEIDTCISADFFFNKWEQSILYQLLKDLQEQR